MSVSNINTVRRVLPDMEGPQVTYDADITHSEGSER